MKNKEAHPIQPLGFSSLWLRWGKRPTDLLISAILLLLLSPVLMSIALLIKVTSRGPVIFVQMRGGLHGRPFTVIKFRTMRGDRFPDPKEIVPLDHKDITRLGRILRRLKIDELPQLLNVWRGEMSLVGPRPTLLDQIESYDAFRSQRLLVRPGITGLAQVYGHSLMTWDERIMYDIAYVRRCGLGLDLWILLRTVLVVLFGERRMSKPFESTRFRAFVDEPAGYECAH